MKLCKKNLVLMALATVLAVPAALANDHSDRDRSDRKDDVDFEGTIRLDHRDDVDVSGTIYVDSAAQAKVYDEQENFGNSVLNNETQNKAEVVEGSASSMSGNIGINMAAGDNNQQANAAALAAADAAFLFGVAEAEVGAKQTVAGTFTNNLGNLNKANASDSLNTIVGNIGINIAAGNSNQQKNDMAATTATASFASANVDVTQKSGHNTTFNTATGPVYETIYSSFAAGIHLEGSYAGESDQQGDVYPDIWTGNTHPNGTQTGHFDLDSDAQGAIDSNQDGGALHFNEAGDITLDGYAVGYAAIPVLVGFDNPVKNLATLSNSLVNVSGNVGLNMAAGTGNQQYNGLAIASSCATCASTGNGGE